MHNELSVSFVSYRATVEILKEKHPWSRRFLGSYLSSAALAANWCDFRSADVEFLRFPGHLLGKWTVPKKYDPNQVHWTSPRITASRPMKAESYV